MMMNAESQLYRLLATEPEGLFEPRNVRLLDEVKVGERDDFVWAEVDVLFQADTLGKNPETKLILLATRHHGYSLKDLSCLPFDVYICRANDSRMVLKKEIDSKDVSIMAWALLLSPGDERENLEEIYESIKETQGNVYYINPVQQ